MKRILFVWLALTPIVMAKSPKNNDPAASTLSYEEKVKAVCTCFESAKPKFECFALQSTHGKTIADPEKRKEFNLATGACDK